jgi:hypothetical protein
MNGVIASAALCAASLRPGFQMHVDIKRDDYGSIRDHNSSSRIG